MKALRKNKKGIGMILTIGGIIVLIILGFIAYKIAKAQYYKEHLTPICNSYGYEKATDHKKTYFDREFSTNQYYLWLECDNTIIENINSTWYDGRFIYSSTENRICTKRDKWGECERHEFSYSIEVK